MGSDHGDSLSADTDRNLHHDTPFHFFSFRNLINFLLGLGWTGVAFYESIDNPVILVIVAIIVGSSKEDSIQKEE